MTRRATRDPLTNDLDAASDRINRRLGSSTGRAARRRLTIPDPSPNANLRLIAAAIDLIHAANAAPIALAAIRERIREADEDASRIRSSLGGGSGGNGISRPTEHAALAFTSGDGPRARADREQMRDDIATHDDMARATRTLFERLAGVVPEAARLCDGRELAGWQVPWTPDSRDPANGWSDPTCRNGAGRRGLCPACLIRHNRWRIEHGLDPLSDAPDD